ncbi:hypothetical protein BN191_650076 [Clostridioides difficile T61]|nr:hypothetical protein BN169_590064 [Clostridioides difficile E16]CCL96794.1 hypothetical protein BN191_650076 [Clostridioides difficile T61]
MSLILGAYPYSFILTKWYVNTKTSSPGTPIKSRFILTKWYVN